MANDSSQNVKLSPLLCLSAAGPFMVWFHGCLTTTVRTAQLRHIKTIEIYHASAVVTSHCYFIGGLSSIIVIVNHSQPQLIVMHRYLLTTSVKHHPSFTIAITVH